MLPFRSLRPDIPALPSPQPLSHLAGAFAELDLHPGSPEECYNDAAGLVHQLTAAIIRAEIEGVTRKEITSVLAPARRVHRASPFIRHCQDMPRGYPGDFQVISRILAPRVSAPCGTVGHALERLALHCPPAQQHRNKVYHQAELVVRTMNEHPDGPRLLSVGCGGAQDLVRGLAGWNQRVHIVLNDLDGGATESAREALRHPNRSLRVLTENALVACRRLSGEEARFDLILVGGLCDYLKDRSVVRLLRSLRSLLAPQGRLYFSNMGRGNPYRAWMDYFFSWRLIERDEDGLMNLIANARIPGKHVRINREGTGLACLVEVSG